MPAATAAPEIESSQPQAAHSEPATSPETAEVKAQATPGPGKPSKAESHKPAAVAPPSSKPPLRAARGGGRGKPDSSASPIVKASQPAPQGPPPPQAPPRPHPADALLAQLAYVVVNEAGASVYSTSQVGRDELPDLDATLAKRYLDRPQASGPAGRAGEDRAPEYRRWALPARRQSQATQGNARVGHLQLRQLRRRRPEHGQRSLAPARLGPQPVDRPADRRLPQGARPVHEPRAVEAGRGDRAGDIHAGGRISQDPRRRAAARPHLDPPRELPASRSSCSRSSASRPRWFATRTGCPSCTTSWPRSTSASCRSRAGSRRVHASRHHRRPRSPRARPARRPSQADLQERHLEDRRPGSRAWSSRGRS